MKSISLIVPIYNSEKFIEDSLKEYYAQFSKKFDQVEIIAVCNGCSDNSLEKCNLVSKYLPVKVIVSKTGKGRALFTGFQQAKYEIIGFIDSDNPFNFSDILKMVDLLKENDMVIASKYLNKNARKRDSQLRRFISLGGGVFTKILFGLKFTDTQAGAKFFKRELWNSIDKNFICTGFDFDIELLYKSQKKGFKIKEHYTPFKYQEFSTVRLRHIPGMVKRLIVLRFF